MTRRLWPVVLAASIGASVGCDSATPTAATPVPAEARPTYTLTGVISKANSAGVAPLEGARVETANGCLVRCPNFTTTDREGIYRLSGLQAIDTHITISRRGYGTVAKDVTMAGDTQLDLQLVREPTYTLSGVVFEVNASGLAAVENVSVYCDGCGEDGHTWSYTDADGRYYFPEVYAGLTPLLVRKEGYTVVDSTRTRDDGTGERSVRVAGDTHFDIQLVRR